MNWVRGSPREKSIDNDRCRKAPPPTIGDARQTAVCRIMRAGLPGHFGAGRVRYNRNRADAMALPPLHAFGFASLGRVCQPMATTWPRIAAVAIPRRSEAEA